MQFILCKNSNGTYFNTYTKKLVLTGISFSFSDSTLHFFLYFDWTKVTLTECIISYCFADLLNLWA